MWGNAILARCDLQITHVDTLPPGRMVAVVFSGIRIINVHAPSGTAKRTEQECFFSTELPVLFSEYTNSIMIGGYLNCILQPADSTGAFITSNALVEIVRGLHLTDMWDQDPHHPIFTHYSPTGASHIDRIYLSTADKERKTGIEIVPTAYTDHHAVVVRLSIPAPEKRRRKMDPFLPPTSLPSSLTSSCHLFLGLPLSLVSKFISNTFLGILFSSILCTCPNQRNLFNLIVSVIMGFLTIA